MKKQKLSRYLWVKCCLWVLYNSEVGIHLNYIFCISKWILAHMSHELYLNSRHATWVNVGYPGCPVVRLLADGSSEWGNGKIKKGILSKDICNCLTLDGFAANKRLFLNFIPLCSKGTFYSSYFSSPVKLNKSLHCSRGNSGMTSAVCKNAFGATGCMLLSNPTQMV